MLLLSPYAPHLAEELWSTHLGHTTSLAYEPWPEADEALLVVDAIKLPVQVCLGLCLYITHHTHTSSPSPQPHAPPHTPLPLYDARLDICVCIGVCVYVNALRRASSLEVTGLQSPITFNL